MKYLLAFSFVLLTILSCETTTAVPQGSAEEAARGFVEAVKVQDFEKARLFCTKQAADAMLDFETNLKMVSEAEKAELMRGFDITVSKVACNENQGTTTCNVCCAPDGTEASIEVVEKDGKWFVQMEVNI